MVIIVPIILPYRTIAMKIIVIKVNDNKKGIKRQEIQMVVQNTCIKRQIITHAPMTQQNYDGNTRNYNNDDISNS